MLEFTSIQTIFEMVVQNVLSQPVEAETIWNMSLPSTIQLLAIGLSPSIYGVVVNKNFYYAIVALSDDNSYPMPCDPNYALIRRVKRVNFINAGSVFLFLVSILATLGGATNNTIVVVMLSSLAGGIVSAFERMRVEVQLRENEAFDTDMIREMRKKRAFLEIERKFREDTNSR